MTSGGNARADAYLSEALEQFTALRSAGNTLTHHFAIAGLVVRVEAARGVTEQSLCRALMHLATEPVVEPDLSIAVWDSASTGMAELRTGWSIEDYGNHGLIRGFSDSRYYAAAQSDPIVIFGMLDHDARRAMYWMRDARELPIWEKGAPFRPLLHEWLRGRGRFPVHGGAVGRADCGVFLAGAGGRGKSNVALACLGSELSYLSDDFCVLTDAPHWQVHSLYSTGKLAAGDLVRHPLLLPHVSNPESLATEKALFFLQDGFAGKIARSLPLKVILMPEVVGAGRCEIVAAKSADALRAVAVSTIQLSGWHGATDFSQVARFVRALPCFTLRLGEDFSNAPARISDLLENLR